MPLGGRSRIIHSNENNNNPESILQQRQAAIIKMVDAALFYFNKYLGAKMEIPICCHPNRTHECDLVILGSITKEYQSRMGILNGDQPNYDKFLLMSVNDVEQILGGITIHFLGAISVGLGGHAVTCSFLPQLFTKIGRAATKVKGLKLESFDSRRRLHGVQYSILPTSL